MASASPATPSAAAGRVLAGPPAMLAVRPVPVAAQAAAIPLAAASLNAGARDSTGSAMASYSHCLPASSASSFRGPPSRWSHGLAGAGQHCLLAPGTPQSLRHCSRSLSSSLWPKACPTLCFPVSAPILRQLRNQPVSASAGGTSLLSHSATTAQLGRHTNTSSLPPSSTAVLATATTMNPAASTLMDKPFSLVNSDVGMARAAAEEAMALARAAAVTAKRAAALADAGGANAGLPNAWFDALCENSPAQDAPRESNLLRAMNLGSVDTFRGGIAPAGGPTDMGISWLVHADYGRDTQSHLQTRKAAEVGGRAVKRSVKKSTGLKVEGLLARQKPRALHNPMHPSQSLSSAIQFSRETLAATPIAPAVATAKASTVSAAAATTATAATTTTTTTTATSATTLVRSTKRAERRVKEQRRVRSAMAVAAARSASLGSAGSAGAGVEIDGGTGGEGGAAAAGLGGQRRMRGAVAAASASALGVQDMFEQYPELLTADQEIELAKGVQELLQLESCRDQLKEDLGREPSLEEWANAADVESPRRLEDKLQRGRACKQRMVSCNMGLVVSVARKYAAWGLSVEELITVGSLGLIRGIEKFDFRRGFKFSTYAHWWIRQAVSRTVADQSRTVRLPLHIYEVMSRINKAREMLWRELGRSPMDEEVAELVGMSVARLHKVMRSWRTPASMDKPIGSEGEDTLGTLLADTTSHEAQEVDIERQLLRKDLQNALHTLSPRERDVMVMRFGLDEGQRPRTLEEIGAAFRVTRERIRQIEVKALWKLRQPNRSCVLKEYMDSQFQRDNEQLSSKQALQEQQRQQHLHALLHGK